MNLKFTNAHWDNAEKTSFTLDVQDLDKEFLDGEVFPFTHVIGNDGSVIAIEVERAYKDLDISDFAPVLPTFEEVQQAKLSELTAITSKFDNQLVNNEMIIKSSLGFSINADLRSQNNIRGLISVGIEPVNFVTAGNSVKSLNIEQLNILLKECALNSQSLYLQKWEYKTKIESGKAIAELDAIDFKFAMTDFTTPIK